jgi:hypothetical protein
MKPAGSSYGGFLKHKTDNMAGSIKLLGNNFFFPNRNPFMFVQHKPKIIGLLSQNNFVY